MDILAEGTPCMLALNISIPKKCQKRHKFTIKSNMKIQWKLSKSIQSNFETSPACKKTRFKNFSFFKIQKKTKKETTEPVHSIRTLF